MFYIEMEVPMKTIKTINALGHVLCHDITKIVRGEVKGVAFKKGHVVTKEDIPELLAIGKDHLFVWEKKEGYLHENEAAEILYKICANEHLTPSEVKEGKITIIAECDGLFKVDVERLNKINELGNIIIASRHTYFPVKKGDKVAATRVIPLVIKEDQLNEAVAIANDTPLMTLNPYKKMKVGIVTTGNEVYYERIKDAFGPVLREKLSQYGITDVEQVIVDDDKKNITEAIMSFIEQGVDMVLTTGGMSVDPDDRTPAAIKQTGADIISYGAPVLPGAMFLMSYYNQIPIIGLPGCVMYAKTTIFDLVLPRVLAGDMITKQYLAGLGHGGLCLTCDTCVYPNCSFGKGSI